MKGYKHLGAVLLAVLIACTPAAAKQDKDKGKDKGKNVPEASVKEATSSSIGKEKWLEITITSEEQDVLRKHVGVISAPESSGQNVNLPPGLRKKAAKGKPLPPGWQKKLARGQKMPQDVYEHAVLLPAVVLKAMPPQPQGTILVKVEGKVVRLAEATRTILDVFDLLP